MIITWSIEFEIDNVCTYQNIYNYNIFKNQPFLISNMNYELWTITKHNSTTSKHKNEFEWKNMITQITHKSVFLNQKHSLQRNYDFNTLSQKWECIYARSYFYTSANTHFHTFFLVCWFLFFERKLCFCVFNNVFIWMKTRSKLRKSLNHIDKS